jgi:hypothetical protein
MNSLVISAAPINYESPKSNDKKPIERKNQTYKNTNSQKIDKNMLQELYKSDTDSDLDMGEFIPVQKSMQKANTLIEQLQFNDTSIDQTSYNNLPDTKSKEIYQQYIDNYNNYIKPNSNIKSLDSNSELLQKLDNILYILEEQKQEQTNLITEELILYVFLGVFIIYVLDSFVRAGKYVR